jgi:hypothetical protein
MNEILKTYLIFGITLSSTGDPHSGSLASAADYQQQTQVNLSVCRMWNLSDTEY